MTMHPAAKVIVAGLFVAGLAALIGAPREDSTPRPAAAPASETTFSGAPLTREHCGKLYREIATATLDAARDLNNPEPRSRHAGLTRLYNTDCPALCGQGGCQ